VAEKAIIIAEKPSVAQRIAKALGGKLGKKVFRIPIYNVRLPDGSNAKVIPVAGHIIEHDFPIKKWVFPVMVPPEKLVLKVNEEKEHFLKLLRDEGRNIDTVIVATDLDSEGSAIALEIIKYLRWDETKKIKRAVFSSTKLDELRRAFENLQPFDYPRAMAGWSRSVIDLLWGANITRGLTISTRNYGDVNVRVISGGRVQSAALKLIVDREKEIREFKEEFAKPERIKICLGFLNKAEENCMNELILDALHWWRNLEKEHFRLEIGKEIKRLDGEIKKLEAELKEKDEEYNQAFLKKDRERMERIETEKRKIKQTLAWLKERKREKEIMMKKYAGKVDQAPLTLPSRKTKIKVREEFFAPCIKKILEGIEDGRKRSCFTLITYLRLCNWSWEEIEEKLAEWGKKVGLKESILKSQLRWHKKQKPLLPANCSNDLFYRDIGICQPDEICKKIKNPINYHLFLLKNLKKSIRKKPKKRSGKKAKQR